MFRRFIDFLSFLRLHSFIINGYWVAMEEASVHENDVI